VCLTRPGTCDSDEYTDSYVFQDLCGTDTIKDFDATSASGADQFCIKYHNGQDCTDVTCGGRCFISDSVLSTGKGPFYLRCFNENLAIIFTTSDTDRFTIANRFVSDCFFP
jgi:hypothetical protein